MWYFLGIIPDQDDISFCFRAKYDHYGEDADAKSEPKQMFDIYSDRCAKYKAGKKESDIEFTLEVTL